MLSYVAPADKVGFSKQRSTNPEACNTMIRFGANNGTNMSTRTRRSSRGKHVSN